MCVNTWMFNCIPLKFFFKKSKPKRILFGWDIIAITIFTLHDIASLILAILAVLEQHGTGKYNDEFKQNKATNFPQEESILLVAFVVIMLIADAIIIFLIMEFGFRLVEDGPWQSKFVLSLLHLIPSFAFIFAISGIRFAHYMFHIHLPGDPVDPEKKQHHYQSFSRIFCEVYGISVFHHFYICFFVFVEMTFVAFMCPPRNKRMNLSAADLLPVEEARSPDGTVVRLQLDAESRNFYPGDSVQGKVVYLFPVKDGGAGGEAANNIEPQAKVKFQGKAEIEWTSGSCCCTKKNITQPDPLANQEVDGSSFIFEIPVTAPPSFSCGASVTGKIVYEITAEVKLGNNNALPVMVTMQINVNPKPTLTSPVASNPLIYEKDARIAGLFGCLPYKNGPFGFALELPKSVYQIGESIHFTVTMFNRTRRPILSVGASLVSVIELEDLTAKGVFEDELIKVWDEVSFGDLRSQETEVYRGKLKVPLCAPENKYLPIHPELFFKSYIFRFFMEIRGVSENLEVDVPIVVGPPLAPGEGGGKGDQSAAVAAVESTDQPPSEVV